MRPRVALIRGGESLESPVASRSARRIAEALSELDVLTEVFEAGEGLVATLSEIRPDVAFICMHGRGGEDGVVQGDLELAEIPYVGPGIGTSLLCWDKAALKSRLLEAGIQTPEFQVIDTTAPAGALSDWRLQVPGSVLVVKPAREGSGYGVSVATDPDQLVRAIVAASNYSDEVLIERFVRGRELAASVWGAFDQPELLPIVEIEKTGPIYDHTAHYEIGAVRLDAPAALSPSESAAVTEACLEVWRSIGASGLVRIDLILSERGTPHVLEVNTIPGYTDTSPTPISVQAAGIELSDLLARLFELAAPKIGPVGRRTATLAR